MKIKITEYDELKSHFIQDWQNLPLFLLLFLFHSMHEPHVQQETLYGYLIFSILLAWRNDFLVPFLFLYKCRFLPY